MIPVAGMRSRRRRFPPSSLHSSVGYLWSPVFFARCVGGALLEFRVFRSILLKLVLTRGWLLGGERTNRRVVHLADRCEALLERLRVIFVVVEVCRNYLLATVE